MNKIFYEDENNKLWLKQGTNFIPLRKVGNKYYPIVKQNLSQIKNNGFIYNAF